MRPNLTTMFDRLNREHFGGEVPSIPCIWNQRLRTTAGYCRYKRSGGLFSVLSPVRIELSEKLFASMDYDLAKVERTMVHEMCHAWCVTKYQEKGHNWRFQQKMQHITGELVNHRCHNYDTSELRNNRNVRMECQRCGKVFFRSKMPKGMRKYCYSHKGCGGQLVFSRVNEGVKVFS